MKKSKDVSEYTRNSDITAAYHTPGTMGERFVKYLALRGNPPGYTEGELGQLYEVFDWLAAAIVYGRPIGGVLISL
jgi:hypothetical protein